MQVVTEQMAHCGDQLLSVRETQWLLNAVTSVFRLCQVPVEMQFVHDCVEAISVLHQKYDFVYFFPPFIFDFLETIIPSYLLLD